MWMNYNTENPMVRDELWGNFDSYGGCDDEEEERVPVGYHELGWRIHLDALTNEQKLTFYKRLKIQVGKCSEEVDIKRHKDYVVVDGLVTDEEEELLGDICAEYEDYGLKSYEV